MSSVIKCKGCHNVGKSGDLKTCSICCGNYHYQCLGITTENYAKESKQAKLGWKCPDCKRPEKRGDNSNTPVRSQSTTSSLTDSGDGVYTDCPDTTKELKEYIDLKLKEAINVILSDIREKIKSENKLIYEKIDEMKTSVQFVSDQFDDMKKQFEEKTNLIEDLKTDNGKLRTEVTEMKAKINIIEQQSRACNLEIQCVPEDKNENLLMIIKQLAKAVSRDIDDTEISNFHRVAKLNQESDRPRTIIARFVSPRIRDDLLSAVKKFNKSHENDKLNTRHLGMGGTKQAVYVTEHLSPANKKLHAETRTAAKEKNYQFVWVRNGKIFVRKNGTSKIEFIMDENSLKKL